MLWSMAVSEEHRRRFDRQVESLREAETDDAGTVERRAQLRAIGNGLRVSAGLAPLPDEDKEPPEDGFYRRAKALGMVARRR